MWRRLCRSELARRGEKPRSPTPARAHATPALAASAWFVGCNASAPLPADRDDPPPASAVDAAIAPEPSPSATTLEPLVSAELWTAVPQARDPFLPWADVEIDCSSVAGFYPENGAFEIDTGRCNFVTVEQPLPTALPEGTELEVELVHFDLVAAEPAVARVAIAFAETDDSKPQELRTIWERSVAIPGPANRIVERFFTDRSLVGGVPVLFHLQNHGQNTWLLVRLDRVAPSG